MLFNGYSHRSYCIAKEESEIECFHLFVSHVYIMYCPYTVLVLEFYSLRLIKLHSNESDMHAHALAQARPLMLCILLIRQTADDGQTGIYRLFN